MTKASVADKQTTNGAERIGSIHPGEILREDFLIPMGITPYHLANSIGVPQTRISHILDGKRAITADTALCLARFFGTSPHLWINLQSHYELDEAEKSNQEAYAGIPQYATIELGILPGVMPIRP